MAENRVAFEFNPLDYPQSLTLPKRFGSTASHEHMPFMKLLVHLLRPKIFVELGVGNGESYLAICEAVSALGMKISCYGVDAWKGDSGSDSLNNLRVQHDSLYGQFSRLIDSSFDEAAAHFSEGSVELLHIDGSHTYEAVCHDWESFRPKMSRNGIVLFHFTNRREGDFGVWRLWEQLRSTYRHFEFLHGHGLGILVLSPGISESLNQFLTMAEKNPGLVRAYFFALGNRVTLHAKAGAEIATIQALESRIQQLETAERGHAEELDRAVKLSHSRADEMAKLERVAGVRADEIAELKHVLESRAAEVTKHQQSTSAHVDEIDALKRTCRAHEADIEKLKEQCQSHATVVEKLNGQHQLQTDEIAKLEQTCRSRANEIDALKATISSHVEGNAKLITTVQLHSDAAEKLNQLAQARAVEIERLEKSGRVQSDERDALTRKITSLEAEIARLNTQNKLRAEDVEKLERTARTRAQEMEEKERGFKKQTEDAEKVARSHSTEIAALERKNADDIAKIQRSLGDEIAKLERARASREDDIKRLNVKIDERDEQIRARDVELLQQKAALEKRAAEITTLSDAKSKLETDPSFTWGRIILAPFRVFSRKKTVSKPSVVKK